MNLNITNKYQELGKIKKQQILRDKTIKLNSYGFIVDPYLNLPTTVDELLDKLEFYPENGTLDTLINSIVSEYAVNLMVSDEESRKSSKKDSFYILELPTETD